MTDQDLTDTFNTAATKIAGSQASTLVTPDWTTALFGLLTSFLSSCFNTPAPSPGGAEPAVGAAPPTSAETIAARMKNMSHLEQAIFQTRAKRYYVQTGMTKQHGLLAAQTVQAVTQEQPVEQLSAAVAHIQGVDASFPQVEMF